MTRGVCSHGAPAFAPTHGAIWGPGRVLWCLPAVLVAVMLIGLSGPADATVRTSQDFGKHFILGQDGWTVRWQARTSDEDGVFRLYAGQCLGSLRVIDLQQANAGNGNYQYMGMPGGSASFFYQLRYVGNDGDEIVLGTMRVDLEGMGKSPATIDSGGRDLKALHEAWLQPALISKSRASIESTVLPEATAPEPEVPPPRPTV